MGVVIRRWLLLECICMVSGCCYMEVYGFLHITYSYSTCISSFLQLLHCSFLKCFFMLILCNLAKVAQRTFEIIKKSRSHQHNDNYNYIEKHVNYESRDFHMRRTNSGIVEISLLYV